MYLIKVPNIRVFLLLSFFCSILIFIFSDSLTTDVGKRRMNRDTVEALELYGYTYDLNASISKQVVKYKCPVKLMMHWGGLVFGILSSSENHLQRHFIRKTWGKSQNILFIVSGPWATVKGEAGVFHDILWIDGVESYSKMASILPQKTQTLLYALESFSPFFDYCLKTDDDSFINVQKLRHFLKQNLIDYGGKVFPNSKPYRDPLHKWFISYQRYNRTYFPPYCSGAGYVMSKRFISCAVKNLKNLEYMPMEDVATGLLSEKCNILPVNMQGVSGKTIQRGDVNSDIIVRHHVRSWEDILHSWTITSKIQGHDISMENKDFVE